VAHLTHQPADALPVEDLFLRQETHAPPALPRRVSGEHEVEVADVVRRDDRRAVLGDVLAAEDRDGPLHPTEHAEGGPDHD
jgi:hypothetical protein